MDACLAGSDIVTSRSAIGVSSRRERHKLLMKLFLLKGSWNLDSPAWALGTLHDGLGSLGVGLVIAG